MISCINIEHMKIVYKNAKFYTMIVHSFDEDDHVLCEKRMLGMSRSEYIGV